MITTSLYEAREVISTFIYLAQGLIAVLSGLVSTQK